MGRHCSLSSCKRSRILPWFNRSQDHCIQRATLDICASPGHLQAACSLIPIKRRAFLGPWLWAPRKSQLGPEMRELLDENPWTTLWPRVRAAGLREIRDCRVQRVATTSGRDDAACRESFATACREQAQLADGGWVFEADARAKVKRHGL